MPGLRVRELISALRPFQHQTRNSIQLGVLLAASGGYLDAFTYIGHGHVFANAMTGNVVLMGISIASGDWYEITRHMSPICAFILGIFVSEALHLPGVQRVVRRPDLICLAVECLVLLIAGGLPHNFPDTPLVLSISFVAALQSASFGRLEDWPYSSVMTTGNLRTCIKAIFAAVVTRDPAARHKVDYFGSICLAFLIGAACGGIFTPLLNNSALWIVGLILLGGMLLFLIERPSL